MKPETQNSDPETRDPKFRTQNPKLETLNSKPRVPKQESAEMALLRRWLEDSRSDLSQKVNQVLKVKSPRKSTRF